jgi:hypothetical protein
MGFENMKFEQPWGNKEFLKDILSSTYDKEYWETHGDKDREPKDGDTPDNTPDFEIENEHYKKLRNFLIKISEQEGVIDKETLVVALKKHSEETANEDEKSMATTLLEEYL